MPTDAAEGPASACAAGTVMDLNSYVPGTSPVMRPIERTLAEVAPTGMPVLLLGESGSGKGAAALQIHRLSSRRQEPFLKINCAGLAPEFFRHAGSSGQHNGSLDRGTVLFDEIGELDATCQSQLLHALPDAGQDDEGCIQARVICSSRHPLEDEVRAGRFREDLYYRLSGVCLHLPSLRQRREDIPELANFFLTKYAALFGRPRPELTAEILQPLLKYSWPGNIRELEHAAQIMVVLGDDRAALAYLRRAPGPELPTAEEASRGVSLKQAARAASRQAERELILKVLTRTQWNRKRAARELQISYKALLYKLKQIGVSPASSEGR